MKDGWTVFSLRITTKTAEILRKLAFKKSSELHKNIYATDFIKYALNKTFKSVKEEVPLFLQEGETE